MLLGFLIFLLNKNIFTQFMNIIFFFSIRLAYPPRGYSQHERLLKNNKNTYLYTILWLISILQIYPYALKN